MSWSEFGRAVIAELGLEEVAVVEGIVHATDKSLIGKVIERPYIAIDVNECRLCLVLERSEIRRAEGKVADEIVVVTTALLSLVAEGRADIVFVREGAAVVEKNLPESLPLCIVLTSEAVGVVREFFRNVLACQFVLCVEVVGLAEELVVVVAEVVTGHSLEREAFEDVGESSEIIFKRCRRLELLFAVVLVAGDRTGHHRHGVLHEVKSLIVEHGLRVINVCREEHALLPEVADEGNCVRIRSAAIVGDSADVQVKLESTGELRVDVRADVILGVVEVAGTEESLLIEVAHAHIVLPFLISAGNAHVVLGLRRHIREHERVPVSGLAGAVRILVHKIFRECYGTASVGLVKCHLVIKGHSSLCVRESRHGRRHLKGERAVVLHGGLAFRTLLSCHKHYPVAAAHTVNRRRSVLEHGDVLNIVGVQPLEVLRRTRNAVNDDERFSESADVHTIAVCSRFGRLLPHAYARHSSREHVLGVLILCLNHILAIHSGHRSCERTTLLRTVADHNHRFKPCIVGRHHDIDYPPSADSLIFRRKSEERKLQHGIGSRLNLIFSVHIRRDSYLRALHHDTRPEHRLHRFIDDRSAHRNCLGIKSERRKEENCDYQYLFHCIRYYSICDRCHFARTAYSAAYAKVNIASTLFLDLSLFHP